MAEVERLVGSRSDVLHFVANKLVKLARSLAREGSPATRIATLASELEPGLMVMGTRGLGTMSDALLCSVLRNVSSIANEHVLRVR